MPDVRRKTHLLIVLDGWGYNPAPEHNAIAAAHTPTWDQLWSDAPHTLISGSGGDVGLPDGQMGNSEVGHMNLGAGRIVHQDLTRIGNAIANTLSLMINVPTPVVTVIIGEGGSEGALALGLSDRTLMQQYAIYSPISMNRTLSSLYPDEQLVDREAAEAMMLTAQDCKELGIINAVVPEPEGGAQDNPREAATAIQIALMKNLAELSKQSQSRLLKRRYKRFRKMGELSSYSQEAMDREVELLMKISTSRLRSRTGRASRRRASESETSEAQLTAPD